METQGQGEMYLSRLLILSVSVRSSVRGLRWKSIARAQGNLRASACWCLRLGDPRCTSWCCVVWEKSYNDPACSTAFTPVPQNRGSHDLALGDATLPLVSLPPTGLFFWAICISLNHPIQCFLTSFAQEVPLAWNLHSLLCLSNCLGRGTTHGRHAPRVVRALGIYLVFC